MPPKLFHDFFLWFCHPELRNHIEGDLMELYKERVNKSGKGKADLKFIIDVMMLFRPGIIRPAEGHRNLNSYGMFKSYFKIGWRNIVRKKLYSIINVAGLALGICACMAIYLITSYEFSFDTFHSDKERIYRVMGDVTESTGGKLHFSKLPVPVSQNARTQLSGLEVIVGVIPYNVRITVPGESTLPKEFKSGIDGTSITTVIAEPQYFDLFKYEWISGNPDNALKFPMSVVLTESKARQYFGGQSVEKIIGRQIIYDDSLTVSVSGIVKDWKDNSDLTFTDFISSSSLQTNFLNSRIYPESWKQENMSSWTYTKLSQGTTVAEVENQLATLIKTNAGSQIKLALWLEPLSNIHFNSDVVENPIRTAHLPTLYSLGAIAIFIFLLAIINFINLSTAQSLQRAKEVGVRKTLGSSSTNLVFQFLIETLIQSCFAVMLAIVFIGPILFAFRSFIPSGVSFQLMEPSILIFLTVIVIITTTFAGLYPAKILSSSLPALTLKGGRTTVNNEKWFLRKGLIIFQFTVSLVFIIGSILISNQLNYTREKELGFNADAIVTVDTPWGENDDKMFRLSERIKQMETVSNVALQWVPPMTGRGRGRAIKFKSTDEKAVGVTQIAGNEDFIPLYQIKILAGRNLVHSDSLKEFVINETLSRLMGCKVPEEALGKWLYWDDKRFPVVGVVADFHSRSFHEMITPVCIINRPDRQKTLAIKLNSKGTQSSSIEDSLLEIEKAWKEIYPAVSFSYQFYDDTLALMYEKDRQTATLINTSMITAIFISCIGLFGLALFTVEKRSKEVSIRKIMGASAVNIATMLSKDFVLLLIVALFIASPIAWYFMNQWLETFAYHIQISWWVFIMAGLASLVLALGTVGYQAIKASIANPVKNLRSE
jgi:putative ABC transport system permease protein